MFWNTDIDFASVPELDILAIGAQPGDVELSCGATLHKMAKAGHKTGVLDLTRGEMTGSGLPEGRLEESKKAGDCLGLLWRGTLAMPDARLENTVGARMTLAGTIRRLRPKTLILPPLYGRNPEQHYTAELGWEACVLSGIPAVDDYSAPHRPDRVIFTTDDNPQFVVDASADFEAVGAALTCYRTRFDDLGPVVAHRKIVLAYLGARIGVPLAEGFTSKDIFEARDLTRLELKTSW
jgi:N-acetylglucosamine malate deacetylase 1